MRIRRKEPTEQAPKVEEPVLYQECYLKDLKYIMKAEKSEFKHRSIHLWCEFDGVTIHSMDVMDYCDYEMIKLFYEDCEYKMQEIAEGMSEFERRMLSYGFRKI